jgi:hypothetical protein
MLTALEWLVVGDIKETEIFPLNANPGPTEGVKPKIMLLALWRASERVIKTGKPFRHVSTLASITETSMRRWNGRM